MEPVLNDIKSVQQPMPNSVFDLLKRPRFDAARDLPASGLVLVTIILGLTGQAGHLALRYERAAIVENLEWWRLISGHFVHLGWSHLLLNLLGCLLVWFLFRRDYRLWHWFLILVVTIFSMDVGFIWLNPSLSWYVGLSGLLHGLFAAGLIGWLKEGGWEAWMMLFVFVAKIGWEQIAGPLPFTAESAGGPVIVNAHLYGAIGGSVAAGLLAATGKIRRRYNAQPSE